MLDSKNFPPLQPGDESSRMQPQQAVIHDRLGNLCAPSAFVIRGLDREKFQYTESQPLYIHLSVTGRCQANCRGCINVAFNTLDQGARKARTSFNDTDPARDARCIINLIKDSPKETVTICLYGGEPLLAPEKIRALMDNITSGRPDGDIRYMLYTNGELLAESAANHPELIEKIWLFSVSIDGTREQHESIRRGTHLDRIHEGLRAIRHRRDGQVLMWSTLREEQSLLDCFDEFRLLHEEGLADQFFWHWVESGDPFGNLEKYARQYEADLRVIMAAYVDNLQAGSLLPITHINEQVLYLLSGRRRNSTACGVELARNYDIVGGRIHSCADLPLQYAIGTIAEDGTPRITPTDLSWLTEYKNDLGCRKCGIHNYCGGRCPVQAVTGSAARLRQDCQLMRLHVSTVNDHINEIAAALGKHRITAQNIYDQSAYYVQFTDGTP